MSGRVTGHRRRRASDASDGSSDDGGGQAGGAGGAGGGNSGPVQVWERQVYLGGLPYTATEDDIRKFLKEAGGSIVTIRAPKYQDTGRLLGYAHVEFSTRDAAQAALRLDGRYIGERFVSVEAAKPAELAARTWRCRPARRRAPLAAPRCL
jgi:RNA recognition motif-containing protein